MTPQKRSFQLTFLTTIALIVMIAGTTLAVTDNDLIYSAQPLGNISTGNRVLIVNPPILRIGSAGVVQNATRGGAVDVNIQLDSNGNEKTTAFSVKFNPDVFTLGAVVTGSDAFAKGFSLILNQDRIAFGELGIVLYNFGIAKFDVSPPANNIVKLTLNIKPTAAPGITPIGFIGDGCPINPGNAPTACSVAGINSIGDPIAIFPAYTDGAVNINNSVLTGNGIEGDINRAVIGIPGLGDGVVDGIDIAQYNLLLLQTLTTGPGGEFQRMDTTGPSGPPGNGCVQPDDKQQIRNYQVGGPVTWIVAAGPTSQGACAVGRPMSLDLARIPVPVIHDTSDLALARQFRVDSVTAKQNANVEVAIVLDSQGNESNFAVSLDFDKSRLTFEGPVGTGPNAFVVTGSGDPTASVTANTTRAEDGHIAIGVDSNSNFSAGTKQVARVIFKVKSDAPSGAGFIRFSDSMVSRQVVLTDFTTTVPTYSDGAVTVNSSASDAGGISISGRVFTAEGQGLRNAAVAITDAEGNRRSVITNSFGFYQIDNVAARGTYVIGVSAKRYRFSSRTIQLTDSLADVNFTGQE